MKNPTDLELYRDKTYLTLCLSLVEDAYKDCQKGNHDLAEAQLRDIIEIFDTAPQTNKTPHKKTSQILPFSKPTYN